MKAPSFHYRRMVELSRPLDPDAPYGPWTRYDIRHESIVGDPASVPPPGSWYIVTHIEMGGHAGTHVEAPLHAVEGGQSVAELEVERFFGDALLLDLSEVPWAEPLDRARLEKAAEKYVAS